MGLFSGFIDDDDVALDPHHMSGRDDEDIDDVTEAFGFGDDL